jgi:transcriptional regulator with XRE-family HTH domain
MAQKARKLEERAVREESRDYESLGSRLKEAREYLGLSQEFVAERLGVPRASISAIETGRRKVSSLELRDLALLYKRPLSHFLGESAEQTDEGKDETARALFRATRNLSEEDKQQVLKFAQFLRSAGRAPSS